MAARCPSIRYILGPAVKLANAKLWLRLSQLHTVPWHSPGPLLPLLALIQTCTYVPSSVGLPSRSSRDTRSQTPETTPCPPHMVGDDSLSLGSNERGSKAYHMSKASFKVTRGKGMPFHLLEKGREGHCHGSWLPPRWGLYHLLPF